MHRNTFINSPKLLAYVYRLKIKPNIYFAGQITGVEGYVESASSGLVAGINVSMDILKKDNVIFPTTTAIGGLSHYISDKNIQNFQPMNVNHGLMDSLHVRIKDKQKRNYEISMRALKDISYI